MTTIIFLNHYILIFPSLSKGVAGQFFYWQYPKKIGKRERSNNTKFQNKFLLCLVLFTWVLFIKKHISFRRISERIVTLDHFEELWLFDLVEELWLTFGTHLAVPHVDLNNADFDHVDSVLKFLQFNIKGTLKLIKPFKMIRLCNGAPSAMCPRLATSRRRSCLLLLN